MASLLFPPDQTATVQLREPIVPGGHTNLLGAMSLMKTRGGGLGSPDDLRQGAMEKAVELPKDAAADHARRAKLDRI